MADDTAELLEAAADNLHQYLGRVFSPCRFWARYDTVIAEIEEQIKALSALAKRWPLYKAALRFAEAHVRYLDADASLPPGEFPEIERECDEAEEAYRASAAANG